MDYIDEEIRTISGPMTVILKSDSKGYENSVRLETEKTAEEYLNRYKRDWTNQNPPFIQLEIGLKDKEWIGKLQTRRPLEELRETGENARELNKEEGVRNKELGERDIHALLVSIPTNKLREIPLRRDNNLLPEFNPFLIPATE